MQDILIIAMFMSIIALATATWTWKEHKWISGIIILLVGLTFSIWLQTDQTINNKITDKTTGTLILDYNETSSLKSTTENGIIFPTGIILIIFGLGTTLTDITWRIFKHE